MFQASVMAEAPLCGIFVSFLLFVPPPLLSSSSADFPASPRVLFLCLLWFTANFTLAWGQQLERSGSWRGSLLEGSLRKRRRHSFFFFVATLIDFLMFSNRHKQHESEREGKGERKTETELYCGSWVTSYVGTVARET